MKVEIKKLKDDVVLPEYAHSGDSGMDIRSIEDMTILPKQSATISTGICVRLPENYELQVRSRSGLASKNNIFVLNSPGTVDEAYTKEIKVILYNGGSHNFRVEKGDRIAQIVL